MTLTSFCRIYTHNHARTQHVVMIRVNQLQRHVMLSCYTRKPTVASEGVKKDVGEPRGLKKMAQNKICKFPLRGSSGRPSGRPSRHPPGVLPGAPPGALAGIVFFVFCKLSKTCHSISCFRRQSIPQQFYLLDSYSSHSIAMTSQDSWASSLVSKAFGFCQRK